jgi:hypothetical protein
MVVSWAINAVEMKAATIPTIRKGPSAARLTVVVVRKAILAALHNAVTL